MMLSENGTGRTSSENYDNDNATRSARVNVIISVPRHPLLMYVWAHLLLLNFGHGNK